MYAKQMARYKFWHFSRALAAKVRVAVSEMRNYLTENSTDDVAGGNVWETFCRLRIGSGAEMQEDSRGMSEQAGPDATPYLLGLSVSSKHTAGVMLADFAQGLV